MKLKKLPIIFFVTFLLSYFSIIYFAQAQTVETDKANTKKNSILSSPLVFNLWPDKAPRNSKKLSEKYDSTRPNDNLVAGNTVIRLTNVSTPQISIYKPQPSIDTKTALLLLQEEGIGFWHMTLKEQK